MTGRGRPSNRDRVARLCEVFDTVGEDGLRQVLAQLGTSADYEILDGDDPAQLRSDLAWFRARHGP